MTNLVQNKKVIVITLIDGSIFYKAYSPGAYKAYIDQWNNLRPIEIEVENYITAKDVKQIKSQMLDEVLGFISTQTLNKEQMLTVYKERIKMNKSWTSLKMFLDALQNRGIQTEQIHDEEATSDLSKQ